MGCQTSVEEAKLSNGSLHYSVRSTKDAYSQSTARNSILSSVEKPSTGQSTIEVHDGKVFRYFGQIVEGCKQGQGQLFIEPAGDLWVCSFERDLPQGYGQIYFGNGDFYEGYLKEGQLFIGKYTHKNGYVFEGEWAHGKKNGYFEVDLKDGTKVVGTFSEDVLQEDANLMDHKGDCRKLSKSERQSFNIC